VSKSNGGRQAGRLLVMGGAEDPDESEKIIFPRLVELAGGRKARIVVCASSAEDCGEKAGVYGDLLRELRVAEVIPARLADRREADAPELLEALERATAVFFAGTDPLRLTDCVGGSGFCERVRERLAGEGLVVSGTSAGASALGETMITGGRDEGTVRGADVSLATGLGCWANTVVDTHLNQRGRLNRLLTAFAENPRLLAIGIDENTAVEVEPGRRLTVIGDGAVIVLAGPVSHTSAPGAGDDEALALSDVRLHVLAGGYGYDLRNGRPVLRGGDMVDGPEPAAKKPSRKHALQAA